MHFFSPESSTYGMYLTYCAHMADLLEASQKLGLCGGGCCLLCTFPVTMHGSTFAGREGGPGDIRRKHNGLEGPHSVLCTLSSVYISVKCRWLYLITSHPLFIGMFHLKVQNSIKSRATICSATVF